MKEGILVPRASVDVKQQKKKKSCVKVEVAVLGSPSLIVRTVPVDIKQHKEEEEEEKELCKSRGGRPGLTVPNSPYGPCGHKATEEEEEKELCKSRGGRPGLTVPNSPYGPCGRNATSKRNAIQLSAPWK